MPLVLPITPCLWFDDEAEQAAKFYTRIVPNSRITKITHYGDEGHEIHKQPKGKVLTVLFELNGQPFTALNGGPLFKLNAAVSLQLYVRTQRELDGYWKKLSAGGDKRAQACGWLKDKFGLSWQVIPEAMIDMIGNPDDPRSERAMAAMMKMKKLDIAKLKKAWAGR